MPPFYFLLTKTNIYIIIFNVKSEEQESSFIERYRELEVGGI